MVMLLWASKFSTVKMECSFKMVKYKHLSVANIYFAVDGTLTLHFIK